LGPGELRTAEKGVGVASEWRQGVGITPSQARTGAMDEVMERQIRWRVEERTKKADPAVAIQKPKPKGGERVEIGGGNERCDQARVDEEPVPLLHGHVEGLDVREFPWETTRKAGE
jgi:hypothetical protein